MQEYLFSRAEVLLAECYAAPTEELANAVFGLFATHIGGWLRGQAWYRLGGWPQADRAGRAEDIAQVVLLHVWLTREKAAVRWLPKKGPLRPWLSSLMNSAMSDLHRREDRFVALPFSQVGVMEDVRPELTVPAKDPNPADDVAIAERLDTFLCALPNLDRQMLEMKMYEQLTQGEIAALLGMSGPVVSRRLTEMTARLTTLLGPGT
jgi:RNA polymerase sigma factor (sigma-70 family)